MLSVVRIVVAVPREKRISCAQSNLSHMEGQHIEDPAKECEVLWKKAINKRVNNMANTIHCFKRTLITKDTEQDLGSAKKLS